MTKTTFLYMSSQWEFHSLNTNFIQIDIYFIDTNTSYRRLYCYSNICTCIPSKHKALKQWCFKVGPSSTTLAQHWNNSVSTPCVYCVWIITYERNIIMRRPLWNTFFLGIITAKLICFNMIRKSGGWRCFVAEYDKDVFHIAAEQL